MRHVGVIQRITFLFCAELANLLIVNPSQAAQEVKATTNPTVVASPSWETLQGALQQARRADRFSVVMSIGAEKRRRTMTTDMTEMPSANDSLPTLAARYGCLVKIFGGVTVVAPSEATLLLPPLHAPNIYTDLPPELAFSLLLSNFTKAQWALFTSERGIGLPDLAGEDARALFVQSIPSRHLLVSPTVAPARSDGDPLNPWKSHERELPAARLRLGQTMRVGLKVGKGPNQGFLVPNVAGKYYLMSESTNNTLFGQSPNRQIRNSLKLGDLNFDNPALSVQVSLKGINTTDDLITRIRQQTGVEIYVDPHYGHKSATFLGVSTVASARDLLQASALCITGTYRKVGDAYVLTDDLRGTGARRQLWFEYCTEGASAQQQKLTEISRRVGQEFLNNLNTLAPTNPALSLTPEQQETAQRNPFVVGLTGGVFPYAQLTPSQQKEVQEQYVTTIHGDESAPPTYSGDVLLSSSVQLELLLPGMDAPVTITLVADSLQRVVDQARDEARLRDHPVVPSAQNQPDSLGALSKNFHRRVLLVGSEDNSLKGDLAARAQKAGFNELWINIPVKNNDSASTLPISSGNPLREPSTLFADAVKKSQLNGMTTYALVDLLKWPTDGPENEVLADRTILGETNIQAQNNIGHRWIKQNVSLSDAANAAKDQTFLLVSPSSPKVRSALRTLLKKIFSASGVDGVVLRNVATEGYNSYLTTARMGYTLDNRVAFLRKYQVDPIDMTSMQLHMFIGAVTPIPEFDEQSRETDDATNKEWLAFRDSTIHEFLSGIAHAVAPANSPQQRKLPILMEQRQAPSGGRWYAQWNIPDGPIPDADVAKINSSNEAAKKAKSKWPAVLTSLPQLPANANKDGVHTVTQFLQRSQQLLKDNLWDGFVLDLSQEMQEPFPEALNRLMQP